MKLTTPSTTITAATTATKTHMTHLRERPMRNPGREAPPENLRGRNHRGGASAHLDLDLTRTRALDLSEVDGEQAVVEPRLDAIGVHRVRQSERALEHPVRALIPVHSLGIFL